MVGVEITFLSGTNSIVIKKKGEAFITTKDAVIFDANILTYIIEAMLKKGYIDYRIIEGILEEIHTA